MKQAKPFAWAAAVQREGLFSLPRATFEPNMMLITVQSGLDFL